MCAQAKKNVEDTACFAISYSKLLLDALEWGIDIFVKFLCGAYNFWDVMSRIQLPDIQMQCFT